MKIVWIPIAVSREQVYCGTARFLPFHLLVLPLGAPGQSWAVVTDSTAASLRCLLFGLSRNGMLTPNVDSCICLDLVLKPVYNQGSERKQALS